MSCENGALGFGQIGSELPDFGDGGHGESLVNRGLGASAPKSGDFAAAAALECGASARRFEHAPGAGLRQRVKKRRADAPHSKALRAKCRLVHMLSTQLVIA